jgi:virulence factor Mce-like protein
MTPRLLTNLIVVALLGVITVGWVVTQLVGTGIGEKPFSVSADFEASGGVFTNQEVTYRGVLVGTVGDMSLNDDGVDVELLIDPEWEGRIPANSIANVQSKSAVGEQFVNLTPTSASGSMLEAGDEIPRSHTKLPVDFQELLTSLDNVLSDIPPAQTKRVVENLAQSLEGRGDDLAIIIRSLADLSEAFADVAPEQQSLLSNATVAGEAFLRTKEEFAAAIKAADKVFAGIGDEPEELRKLFVANDRFARKASAFLAKRGDDLHAGIRGLEDLVAFQLRNKEDVLDSLEYVPQFLHAVEDASVPWRSPDGREFYRIRVGLIVADVPASWPCKYVRPFGYERQAHEREARRVFTSLNCQPSSGTAAITGRSLVRALRAWLGANPPPPLFNDTALQVRDRYFTWPKRPSSTLTPGPTAAPSPVAEQ